jgi:hypothetical protein
MSRPQMLFAGGVILLGLIVWFQAHSLNQKPAQSAAAKAAAAERAALQQTTAHPMNTIVVRASFNDNDDVHPVSAQVWVDGKQRADAPLVMELDPGPHTVRVNNHGQDSPVRVVTIPGADRQVLDFQFKKNDDSRSFVVLRSEAPSLLDRVVAINAYLEGLSDDDIKEMHVNLRDGVAWREFPMTVYRAPGGVAGSVVIPAQLLAGGHPDLYYVTATHTMTNVQYFTEMQNAP